MGVVSSLRRAHRAPNAGLPPGGVQSDLLAALCYCLVYDLCAWLAGSRSPVPADVREYRREDLRPLPHPRDRLCRYLAPQLLQAWERALAPFFAAGGLLVPRLQETGALELLDPQRDGAAQVRLRFSESGCLLGRGGPQVERPAREWLLTVESSPDRLEIQAARLEQVGA